MPEPSSYIMAKLASGIGGLFGGLALMSYIRPKTVGDAALRGGISTGSGIIFAAPLLSYLNIRSDWEMQLMAGGILGFISWSILSMLARVFQKAEDNRDDIIDVVNRVRGKESTKPKTVKKTPRKKTTKRKTTRVKRK